MVLKAVRENVRWRINPHEWGEYFTLKRGRCKIAEEKINRLT